MKYDLMLHWIKMKYDVSRMKMPGVRESATSLLCTSSPPYLLLHAMLSIEPISTLKPMMMQVVIFFTTYKTKLSSKLFRFWQSNLVPGLKGHMVVMADSITHTASLPLTHHWWRMLSINAGDQWIITCPSSWVLTTLSPARCPHNERKALRAHCQGPSRQTNRTSLHDSVKKLSLATEELINYGIHVDLWGPVAVKTPTQIRKTLIASLYITTPQA